MPGREQVIAWWEEVSGRSAEGVFWHEIAQIAKITAIIAEGTNMWLTGRSQDPKLAYFAKNLDYYLGVMRAILVGQAPMFNVVNSSSLFGGDDSSTERSPTDTGELRGFNNLFATACEENAGTPNFKPESDEAAGAASFALGHNQESSRRQRERQAFTGGDNCF
jgi:hypothetical protein